jgi:hypothetical protein
MLVLVVEEALMALEVMVRGSLLMLRMKEVVAVVMEYL